MGSKSRRVRRRRRTLPHSPTRARRRREVSPAVSEARQRALGLADREPGR